MRQIEKLVSQETLNKFKAYERLLRAWNRRTALVQKDTLEDFYSRHILDSLQIVPIIEYFISGTLSPINLSTFLSQPNTRLDGPAENVANISIIDVGTGAGFPGLVLAICGFKGVALCESNHRKCVFLEEVARQTHTNVRIINQRVEDVDEKFDLMVSRACTDLNGLCSTMWQISRTSSSFGIFHKGKNWKEEVYEARKHWNFDMECYQSLTSETSSIILLRKLEEI